MYSRLEMAERVTVFSSGLRGVFSLADLRNLLQTENRSVFYRGLKALEQAGLLSRFCRGFYITPSFDPMVLSQRLCQDSYISFGNALARHLLIGSVSRYRIRAAKPGPKRVTPFSPALGLVQRLFQGVPRESKFLGASQSPERRGWRSQTETTNRKETMT